MRRNFCSRFVCSIAAVSVISGASLAGPPASRVDSVVETIHGAELTDDYRWLEGDENGNMTEEVTAWTDTQNAYTRSVLDNLPGREGLESRLRELMEIGSVSTPTMRRDRYFYSRREGSENQASIFLKIGADGEARRLLDPNEIDESGLVTISWYVPNHDGTLLAFGMYRSGDENSTGYVLDVESGDWLADEVPGKVGGLNWTPDSKGFFYRSLADTSDPYSGRIKYHKLGTHARQDKTLFKQYTEGPWAKTYGPYARVSEDARWMILGYSKGWQANDLWAIDLERWFRTGEFVKVDILVDVDANGGGPVWGDTLYMETTLDAPNGRVIAIDLNNPERENWNELIPERSDAVLQGVSVAKGLLVAQYLKNASTAIEQFDMQGRPLGAVDLPGIGSAGIATRSDRTEAYLTFSSYNEPRSIYKVDLADGSRELWDRPEVPVDPSSVEVKQVWYKSKDGTKVSMFIIHNKGLKLDGTNPTILYGYGGFNISMTPRFSATMFPWYENGGVYAVANLRGGGEYGEAWHEAGMKGNKQNVFDDLYAAAQWLVDNGYTSPEHLGVAGGSNGGLLTGAAVTQRPDLFSAVISAVPLLDMVRYHDFLMARYWVPEYGSSEDAEQFKSILAYSPYQNIKPGTNYPAVLFTAGENDARVHPLHARKMAAAMQAASASDQTDEPIMIWVDRDAGHGAGKPLDLRVRDVADQRIFMMWQLGMLDR